MRWARHEVSRGRSRGVWMVFGVVPSGIDAVAALLSIVVGVSLGYGHGHGTLVVPLGGRALVQGIVMNRRQRRRRWSTGKRWMMSPFPRQGAVFVGPISCTCVCISWIWPCIIKKHMCRSRICMRWAISPFPFFSSVSPFTSLRSRRRWRERNEERNRGSCRRRCYF